MFTAFRYEKELDQTRWTGVRKGAIFGIFTGWSSFVKYIVYSIGFIFGSLLMSYEDHKKISVGDVLVVSISHYKLIKEQLYNHFFHIDRFCFCIMFGDFGIRWSLLSIVIRSPSCSSIGISTDQ